MLRRAHTLTKFNTVKNASVEVLRRYHLLWIYYNWFIIISKMATCCKWKYCSASITPHQIQSCMDWLYICDFKQTKSDSPAQLGYYRLHGVRLSRRTSFFILDCNKCNFIYICKHSFTRSHIISHKRVYYSCILPLDSCVTLHGSFLCCC